MFSYDNSDGTAQESNSLKFRVHKAVLDRDICELCGCSVILFGNVLCVRAISLSCE